MLGGTYVQYRMYICTYRSIIVTLEVSFLVVTRGAWGVWDAGAFPCS